MLKFCPKVTYVGVDDQLVITNNEQGKVIVLENIGKEIMQYIIEETPISTIVKTLAEKYDQEDISTIRSDVEEFINDLLTLGILFEDCDDNEEYVS